MNLNQLYCFKILARYEHLTKAAEELNYSVPALSVIISRLECELGVKLFNRVGRNIKLNERGLLFLQYVDQSLNALDEGIKRLSETQENANEVIRIGTFSHQYWLGFLNTFLATNQNVFISRIKLTLPSLANETNIDQYDFIISPESDFHHANWNSSILIHNESPVVVLSPQIQLHTKQVSLKDLTNEKIIVLSKQESLRKYFDELCKRNNVSFKNIIESDIFFRRELMYGADNYIAFTTDLALSMGFLADLRSVPVETDMPKRKIAIYWRKDRYLTKNMQSLLDSIQEYSRIFEKTHLNNQSSQTENEDNSFD
ncbi:LysR family transcriptional regulator [[Clostridium] symbiosum]|uniref:LysR family transcriptional regulator n=1 Tax=Clostridium symbiosum TaxID=1512 RepID=UPI001D060C88|nr:LysR family transcriptional regulator [[Clostridium] symbiosum]MCB6607285.1 LysR family transcriptional regulator [[Clostridium] symbiosum]MCB6929845.1 LysR family transcriptional regulator [[Clostridium] symbiosum]